MVPKKVKSMSALLLLTVLTISTLSILTPKIRTATPSVKLKVLPSTSTFYINETLPGETFTINITVQNVTYLSGWQVNITWNPSLLENVSATIPSDNVFDAKSFIPVHVWGTGSLVYAAQLLSSSEYFSGNGTLFQLELKILPNIPPVSCNLSIVNPYVDTFLVDNNGYSIQYTKEDGKFEYLGTYTQPSVTLSPSGTTVVNVGENVTFTANISNGLPPYTIRWYLNSAPVSGADNLTSWEFNFASSGTYTIKVNVTDSVANSAVATAYVTTRILSVGITPSSIATDLYGTLKFTANASGGKPPYTYTWYIKYPNGTEIGPKNIGHTTWSVVFNVTGIHRVKVSVTDFESTTKNATSTVRVLPTPTTDLLFDPSVNTYYTNMTKIGDQVIINLTIQNVTLLGGWQVNITWDPSLLDYVTIGLPSNHIFAGQTYIPLGPFTGDGTVVFGLQLMYPDEWNFTGTGILCQLKLQVARQPASPQSSCTIGLANKYVDTVLLDAGGLIIPSTISNANYTYVLVEHVTHLVLDNTVETYSDAIILANSVIPSDTAINFTVYGASGTDAFVNVTIPKALLKAEGSPWVVYLNGADVTSTSTITSDADNTYVYLEFTFASSATIKIQGSWIIPELGSLLLMVFLVASLMAVILAKASMRKKL
jgi:hypothetical protein